MRGSDCRSLLSREGIFICYRHDDVAAAVLFTAAELKRRFGRSNVFYDVGLQERAGADFREELAEQIRSSYALIVVIGPRWLSAMGRDGRRRLDDPEDFVRLEIELALQEDLRVIPLLVERARMPGRGDLPPSMEAFAFRQAQVLSYRRPAQDVQALIERLEQPPPHRFVPWRELTRHARAGALVTNALWRPWWTNVVVPLILAVAGVLTGRWWLAAVALLVYAGFVAATLFDIWEARCVALRAPPIPSKAAAPALPLVQPGSHRAEGTVTEP
jgi:hypothetical protein